jgi:hypothetical protein
MGTISMTGAILSPEVEGTVELVPVVGAVVVPDVVVDTAGFPLFAGLFSKTTTLHTSAIRITIKSAAIISKICRCFRRAALR